MTDISQYTDQFDPADHKEFDDSPLPLGDYYVEIEDVIFKETNNKKGKGLNITFNVLGDVHDHKHGGRKLFGWFTLQHESAEAERIGRNDFYSLKLAICDPTLTDTDALIGENFVARVGSVKDKRDGTMGIKIKKYMVREGYVPGPKIVEAPKKEGITVQVDGEVKNFDPATGKTLMPWDAGYQK